MRNYRAFLGLSITTLVLFATIGIAAAQEASQEAADQIELEEVIVTGTRIARRDFEANSPIVTVSAVQLERAGEVSMEMTLQQLPQLVPDMNANVPLLREGGRAQINLRGLGANRNLVLLDGRRMISSDLSGNIDLNTIPSTLIDSIEIITGGASAVYGSEAIAGVVNFKLKRDFEGFEIDAQYGEAFKGDAATQQYSITTGSKLADGRGHAVLHLNYMKRDKILQGDRTFYDDATLVSGLPMGQHIPSVSNLPTQAAVDEVFAQYGVAPGTVLPTRTFGFNDDDTLFPTSGTIVNYNSEQRPFMVVREDRVLHAAGQYISLVQPLERYSIFGKIDYELTDNIRTYSQFTFAQNDVHTSAGPTSPRFQVSPDNILVPADLKTILDSRPDPDASFQVRNVLGLIGLRTFGYRFTTYQVLAGFTGDLPNSDLTWDVYASHGTAAQRFAVLGSSETAAIETLTLAQDGGASNCEGGLDVFGFNNGIIQNNTISDECVQFIIRQPKTETNTRQNDLQATLTGGLGELPAGEVRFAATAGYRSYGYVFRPDSLSFQALPDGGTNFEASVDASDSLWEASGELLVPLLRDKPGAQALNVNVAARYSDYESSGGTWTYKADMEWQPVSQLRFRGGYQRAIRAPNPSELFGGASSTRANLGQPEGGAGDPCDIRGQARNGPDAAELRALCIAQGLPEVLVDTYQFLRNTTGAQLVANPDLEPEEADTYTVGFVWTPELEATNVRLSLDYYDIKIKGAISSFPVDVVINKCYNIDGSNPSYSPSDFFCELHRRDPNEGTVQNFALPLQNIAGFRTSGFDLAADVNFGLGAGNLSLGGVINYLEKYLRQINSDEPFEDVSGVVTPTAGNAFQPILPEWKGLLTIDYDFGDFRVGTRIRYIHSMIDQTALTNPETAPPGVSSYTYVDLNAGWQISERINLRAGVINLFDKEPAIVRGTPGVTNPATYDAIGVRYYIGLKTSF